MLYCRTVKIIKTGGYKGKYIHVLTCNNEGMNSTSDPTASKNDSQTSPPLPCVFSSPPLYSSLPHPHPPPTADRRSSIDRRRRRCRRGAAVGTDARSAEAVINAGDGDGGDGGGGGDVDGGGGFLSSLRTGRGSESALRLPG